MVDSTKSPTQTQEASEHILAALEASGWQVSEDAGAAKLLRIKPTTLTARMKKLGIQRKSK